MRLGSVGVPLLGLILFWILGGCDQNIPSETPPTTYETNRELHLKVYYDSTAYDSTGYGSTESIIDTTFAFPILRQAITDWQTQTLMLPEEKLFRDESGYDAMYIEGPVNVPRENFRPCTMVQYTLEATADQYGLTTEQFLQKFRRERSRKFPSSINKYKTIYVLIGMYYGDDSPASRQNLKYPCLKSDFGGEITRDINFGYTVSHGACKFDSLAPACFIAGFAIKQFVEETVEYNGDLGSRLTYSKLMQAMLAHELAHALGAAEVMSENIGGTVIYHDDNLGKCIMCGFFRSELCGKTLQHDLDFLTKRLSMKICNNCISYRWVWSQSHS